MYFIFLAVCFLASVIGAICGIGGGVIIKPVLDALGVMDVAAISFLSGCAVLAMTTYSVVKGRLAGDSKVEMKTAIPIAAGAVLGGVLGKWMFSFLSSFSSDKNRIGAIQAACLIVITVGTLVYTLYKNRIKTYHVRTALVSGMIGIFLGLLSSFLGIGGGPINLVVLFFFFSMTTKTAAEYSLYIIFFSQIASLLTSLITRTVPDFQPVILILMAAGGILGGICGRSINRKIKEKTVDRLFIGLMAVIICINLYNFFRFIA
ncbi:MAG: sulfite exporter TauE/SafE family protein [Lachnospiraceae bacterium]|nr:sulfite exporter TauE/SafE family protein [Lachnospiraceae bacterium]